MEQELQRAVFADEVELLNEIREEISTKKIRYKKTKMLGFKKQESGKSNWISYVNSVHKDMSKNGKIPVPYYKAIAEASRRKKMTKESEILKIKRDTKIKEKRLESNVNKYIQEFVTYTNFLRNLKEKVLK